MAQAVPSQPIRSKRRFPLSRKFTVGFALLAVVLVGTLSALSYVLIKQMTERYYTDKVVTAVETVSEILEGELVLEAGETGVYPAAFEPTMRWLNAIKEHAELKYLYVFTLGEEGVHYIYTAHTPTDDDSSKLPIGTFESYEDLGGRELFDRAMETGLPTNSLTFEITEAWGYVASSFAPVFDADGKPVALVGADYSMEDILGELRRSIVLIVLVVLVVISIMIALYLLVLRRTLIRPVTELTESVRAFVQNDGGGEERLEFKRVDIRTNDEIGDLNGAFARMAEDINEYMGNLRRVTAEKEKITAELNVASKIQMMLLPRVFPPFHKGDNLAMYATMEPAKNVGGDFYDFYMIDPDHVGMTIADVSGKGVPAALFMVIAKTILKNLACTGLPADEVMTIANNQLADNNDEGMFVTTFLAVLELSTGKFTYANGGHNPPLISRQGAPFEFLASPKQLVVAGMPGIRYKLRETSLKYGDRMFFYTDGVTEAMNAQLELYGDDRLIRDVNAVCHENKPLPELLALYRGKLGDYVQGAEQSDDITMMLLEYGE